MLPVAILTHGNTLLHTDGRVGFEVGCGGDCSGLLTGVSQSAFVDAKRLHVPDVAPPSSAPPSAAPPSSSAPPSSRTVLISTSGVLSPSPSSTLGPLLYFLPPATSCYSGSRHSNVSSFELRRTPGLPAPSLAVLDWHTHGSRFERGGRSPRWAMEEYRQRTTVTVAGPSGPPETLYDENLLLSSSADPGTFCPASFMPSNVGCVASLAIFGPRLAGLSASLRAKYGNRGDYEEPPSPSPDPDPAPRSSPVPHKNSRPSTETNTPPLPPGIPLVSCSPLPPPLSCPGHYATSVVLRFYGSSMEDCARLLLSELSAVGEGHDFSEIFADV
ncbi:hypothetical protein TeGR_g13684, partial [Tetraparma gracilis]